MKYEANAGPPKGDHPTDRAINALPLPQYPIAPPVAAGSVDTPEFREVLHAAIMCKSSMQIQCNAALLDHIDAWGAQQRYAGIEVGRAEYQESFLYWNKRAEKAEASLKNFHRSLCDRFGYVHDPVDWQRDQVSLEEHIAAKLTNPEIQHHPV